MGRARQLKRLQRSLREHLYKDLAHRPPPPSKTYTDAQGVVLTHRELPSLAWEPMRQDGTLRLGNGEEAERWVNRWYSASCRRYAVGFPWGNGPYAIVGLTHVSETALHDWRDMQAIKNDVCDPEWEGVELYPSESRLVDPSNRFYLWCCPPGVLLWGLPTAGRRVLSMAQSIAPQRPFPAEATPC